MIRLFLALSLMLSATALAGCTTAGFVADNTDKVCATAYATYNVALESLIDAKIAGKIDEADIDKIADWVGRADAAKDIICSVNTIVDKNSYLSAIAEFDAIINNIYTLVE